MQDTVRNLCVEWDITVSNAFARQAPLLYNTKTPPDPSVPARERNVSPSSPVIWIPRPGHQCPSNPSRPQGRNSGSGSQGKQSNRRRIPLYYDHLRAPNSLPHLHFPPIPLLPDQEERKNRSNRSRGYNRISKTKAEPTSRRPSLGKI